MTKVFLKILTPVIAVGLSFGHWYGVGYPVQLAEQAEARSLEASVEPLPLLLSCPGAFTQLGGSDGTDLGSVERLGEALISAAAVEDSLLIAPELSSSSFSSALATGQNQSTALLSMLQSQAVDQSRAVGIQASYCGQPSAEGWLLNGSAIAGSESVLIAGNPAAVEALVEIEIHSPTAVVSDRFALAPGEEQLISLARYANGEENFALFFRTNGPEILMAVQNRETRGLTPIGIELAATVAGPATEQFFVGLRELTGGFTLPEIRIFNPSESATEVTITALDGENVELFRVQVPAAGFATQQLNISDQYQLLKLESEQPVLAAVKSASTQSVLDFAWLLPAERFRSLTLPLTRYQNSIVLANPDATAVELTVSITTETRTSVQSLVLQGLGTLSLPVAGKSVQISGNADFLAALEILDPAGYSIVTPTENANLGNDLLIQID